MRLTWIAAATILISTQANAGIEQQITDCSRVSDKLERLICYDSLAERIRGGDSSEPTPAAKAAAANTQTADVEEEFGQLKKADEVQIDKIYLEVSQVSKDAYGALKVTFSNGQVWKQTDTRRFKLKQNQRVFIEKAAFGSFKMGSDDRNATVRVKRLK